MHSDILFEVIHISKSYEIGFNIFKGLQAAVTLNVFYDHDIKVQITDYNAPNGINGTGRRASVTEQFRLKYNVTV